MQKTYLTEYTEDGKTTAGPKIEAESFDNAETKLQTLIYFGMVPERTKVSGELIEELDLNVGA
jgi:hypothetical protein